MWKKSPFVLIITLSLWRSPIPNTYVATQYLRWRSIQESYAAQLLAKRSVAVASGSEIGGSTSIPWSLPRQSNRNMHTRLIPLYLFLQTLPPTSWCMYHSSALPLQPLFSSLEISLRINYSSNEYELILICSSYDFQHFFYICAQWSHSLARSPKVPLHLPLEHLVDRIHSVIVQLYIVIITSMLLSFHIFSNTLNIWRTTWSCLRSSPYFTRTLIFLFSSSLYNSSWTRINTLLNLRSSQIQNGFLWWILTAEVSSWISLLCIHQCSTHTTCCSQK